MNELGDLMKVFRFISLIIITLFLIQTFPTIIPNAKASIAPKPDQFIAEIFPNKALPLQLSHTNTIVKFNATNFPNELGLNFDANYTIYNQENTTTIPLILPFSLAININDFMFEVQLNETQIPYSLLSVSPWNENITEVNIRLPGFIETYPINLVRSNVTLFKNSSSVVRYQFRGTMNNPLASRDLIYIIYSLGTSPEWLGNTTGRVELRVYGKQPIFSTSGGNLINLTPKNVDIVGGKSFSYEWYNIQIPWGNVGIKYYRDTSTLGELIISIILNLLISIAIASAITVVILRRRKIKKM